MRPLAGEPSLVGGERSPRTGPGPGPLRVLATCPRILSGSRSRPQWGKSGGNVGGSGRWLSLGAHNETVQNKSALGKTLFDLSFLAGKKMPDPGIMRGELDPDLPGGGINLDPDSHRSEMGRLYLQGDLTAPPGCQIGDSPGDRRCHGGRGSAPSPGRIGPGSGRARRLQRSGHLPSVGRWIAGTRLSPQLRLSGRIGSEHRLKW